jgi:hypothetical protein
MDHDLHAIATAALVAVAEEFDVMAGDGVHGALSPVAAIARSTVKDARHAVQAAPLPPSDRELPAPDQVRDGLVRAFFSQSAFRSRFNLRIVAVAPAAPPNSSRPYRRVVLGRVAGLFGRAMLIQRRTSPMLRHGGHTGSLSIGRCIKVRIAEIELGCRILGRGYLVSICAHIWNENSAQEFHEQQKAGPTYRRGRPPGFRCRAKDPTGLRPVTSHRTGRDGCKPDVTPPRAVLFDWQR